jgi:hypothetical protein
MAIRCASAIVPLRFAPHTTNHQMHSDAGVVSTRIQRV